MEYIRNCWYPASWSTDLGAEPISRIFLEEEVVLYRGASGQPVALANMCPHRFAALSKGKLHGDAIACPYHGLQFSPDGSCKHNPHGPVTGAIRVRSYPLAERYGMIWIWMGEPDKADPASLPEIPDRESEAFDWVGGYLHVDGNYQLVIDNLLDLSHVEFMHPFLADLDDDSATDISCTEEAGEVTSRYIKNDARRSKLVDFLWPASPPLNRMVTVMQWSAPANLVQSNSFAAANDLEPKPGEVLLVPLCHLITPETAHSSHYFWASGRNMLLNNPSVDEMMSGAMQGTFVGEDEPMIADIQERMGARQLMEMKPLLLSIDKSAVLARRRVERLIGAEQSGTAATAA